MILLLLSNSVKRKEVIDMLHSRLKISETEIYYVKYFITICGKLRGIGRHNKGKNAIVIKYKTYRYSMTFIRSVGRTN